VIEHEVAILSRMVQTGTVLRYDHLLRPEFFSVTNREVYAMLRTYELQYGVCMDEATFLHQVPGFAWSPSNVQVEWYADELCQSFVQAKAQSALNEIDLEGNPKAAVKDLSNKLYELLPYIGDAVGDKVALFEHARERLRRAREHRTTEEISGVTTGFSILDRYTNGTQREEIEIWAARPGNTKSLTLLYGAYHACISQGLRISFISPEMSAYEHGIRLDSMHYHLSSMKLQSGRMTDEELEVYADLTEDTLAQLKTDIAFRDSIALRRKFTTGDVHRIVEADKPDLIMIDGLLLIDSVRPSKDIRSRVTNVMEELKSICASTGVPIRIAHQVNREPEKRITRSTKAKGSSPLDPIPQLHELAEAGSTEQYASRVICMRYFEGRIYYAIRKNRNGPEGKFVSVAADIDVGRFTDERELTEDDRQEEPKQEKLSEDEQYGF
jgi:replicative DNA helicase